MFIQLLDRRKKALVESVAGRAAGKPSERSGIIRDATWYTVATYISQFLAFGIGVIAKRLLGPADLGIWAVLLSLLSFLGLLEFGVIQATNRQMSYALSKGDEVLAETYKRVQFSFVGVAGLVGGAGLLLYVLVAQRTISPAFGWGLASLAVILPLTQLHLGQVTVYWANKRFAVTSLLTLVETGLMGTLGLLLIWRVGLYGQMLAFLAVLLAKIGYLTWQAHGQSRFRVAFGWNLPILRELLSIGFPLQVISLVNLLKLSGTSLLVAYVFDTTAAGYYALALSIQNYVYWTPNAFSIVMFPRFQARMADSNDDATALHSYLVKPTVGLGYFVLPVLISASYFLVPVLIRHALPAYGPSIPVLKVLLAGTYFLSMEHMPGQLLTTVDRLWERVSLSALTVVLLAVCLGVALLNHPTLFTIVASLAVANAIAFLANFEYAYRIVGGPKVDRWFSARLVGVFTYLMFVLVATDHAIPLWGHSLWKDALSAAAKWALALAFLAPVFLLAERQLSLRRSLLAFLGTRHGRTARVS
jgi:O-antigen/teichoic acid export membrane protein